MVAGADEVTVTLSNRKTYTAKVVGADPSYDLAVVKVDAKNLPFIIYGNSDDVKIGQWVLALGYPLTSGCNCNSRYYQCQVEVLRIKQG